MAKHISIPKYRLDSLLRHYAALAAIDVAPYNTRALNAKRVAKKEIESLQALIDRQCNDSPDKPLSPEGSRFAR